MHLVSVVVNDRAAPVDVGAQYGRAMTSSMDDELTYDKAQVHTVLSALALPYARLRSSVGQLL